MEQINDIVERYQKADPFESLCIYLQYRDIRDDFQEIDDGGYSQIQKMNGKMSHPT